MLVYKPAQHCSDQESPARSRGQMDAKCVKNVGLLNQPRVPSPVGSDDQIFRRRTPRRSEVRKLRYRSCERHVGWRQQMGDRAMKVEHKAMAIVVAMAVAAPAYAEIVMVPAVPKQLAPLP